MKNILHVLTLLCALSCAGSQSQTVKHTPQSDCTVTSGPTWSLCVPNVCAVVKDDLDRSTHLTAANVVNDDFAIIALESFDLPPAWEKSFSRTVIDALKEARGGLNVTTTADVVLDDGTQGMLATADSNSSTLVLFTTAANEKGYILMCGGNLDKKKTVIEHCVNIIGTFRLKK